MKLGPAVVDIDGVPQPILDGLEHAALAGIYKILEHVPVIPLTVPIDPSFDKRDVNVVKSNITMDGSFGSVSAATCLIVFFRACADQQVVFGGYTCRLTNYKIQ